jgi:DNA-binding NtrC family response regulator
VAAKTQQTILVVEDEEMVLGLLDEMLKIWGYQPLLAGNGEEAVNIAKTYTGEIHLALLDMGMPIMSGAAAYPLLKQARPDMKIILCSGYELDETAQSVLAAGASAFIQKPFEMDALAAEIRRTLSD